MVTGKINIMRSVINIILENSLPIALLFSVNSRLRVLGDHIYLVWGVNLMFLLFFVLDDFLGGDPQEIAEINTAFP